MVILKESFSHELKHVAEAQIQRTASHIPGKGILTSCVCVCVQCRRLLECVWDGTCVHKCVGPEANRVHSP